MDWFLYEKDLRHERVEFAVIGLFNFFSEGLLDLGFQRKHRKYWGMILTSKLFEILEDSSLLL